MIQVVIGLVLGFALNQVVAIQQRRWNLRDDERRHDRERTLEERRWLRDRRSDAYLELSRAVDNFFYVAIDVCDRLPAREELNLAMRRLDEAGVAVRVLGSRPARDAAQLVAVAGYQAFAPLYNADGPVAYEELPEAREFSGTQGVFDRVVRHEMSDPDLPLPGGLAEAAARSARYEVDLHEQWGEWVGQDTEKGRHSIDGE